MAQQPLVPTSTWSQPINALPISVYPKKIQALVRALNTPQKVQGWVYSLTYNKKQTMYGLRGVFRRGRAHCLEAVLSAAAILEQHGYPPLILDMESTDLLDHTLFLFRHQGKYGAVGMSRDVGLYGRKPIYTTIHALVQSYAAPYIDEHACLKAYAILDLRTLGDQRWRTFEQGLWYVEEALRNIPHRKLELKPRYIRDWRKRFVRFKKEHPGQQPDYFPHQENWM